MNEDLGSPPPLDQSSFSVNSSSVSEHATVFHSQEEHSSACHDELLDQAADQVLVTSDQTEVLSSDQHLETNDDNGEKQESDA